MNSTLFYAGHVVPNWLSTFQLSKFSFIFWLYELSLQPIGIGNPLITLFCTRIAVDRVWQRTVQWSTFCIIVLFGHFVLLYRNVLRNRIFLRFPPPEWLTLFSIQRNVVRMVENVRQVWWLFHSTTFATAVVGWEPSFVSLISTVDLLLSLFLDQSEKAIGAILPHKW